MSDRKKADFFIDGQNLFLSVKGVFGYQHPNFDVRALCKSLADKRGWETQDIYFYTGMPSQEQNVHWHDYWSRRLADMVRSGIHVFNPPLRYHRRRVQGEDGQESTITQGTEKGVDVRIAIDMIESVLNGSQVLVVLSQDNDLSIAAERARKIGLERLGHRVEVASAFPALDPAYARGIQGTTWMPMDKAFYDANIDPRDYRTASMRQIQEDRDMRRKALSDPRMMGQRPGRDFRPSRVAHDPLPELSDAERVRRANLAAQCIPGSCTPHVSKKP